ncbi:MAG: choice-of-anchor B family protein, partial [Bacteroidota bacterium]
PFCVLAQEALHVQLFDQTQRDDVRYSGCWSYTAADGSEYALLGAQTGTAIYAIDQAPVTELAFIPGYTSNWREITVLNDFAYVTTEATDAEGLQIIDLRALPDTATLVGIFDETFRRGHILQRDIYSDAPYIYINGTRSSQGVHILDVSVPDRPVEVGVYDPDYYIHDSHIRGDRLYACAGNEGVVDIVDISDKSQPKLLAQISNITGYVHSAWSIRDDYLMVAVETDGLPARMYDISDLNDIEEVARYTANTASLVHNPYLRGDFMFISHNTEGLRVLDVADPRVPVEVGFYDTFDGPSGGFSGLWSACPYFPSGKIIGGNRTDGLYVWTFDGTRAARLYGRVTDATTGEPIARAVFKNIDNNQTFRADLTGNYAEGFFADTYTFEVEQTGYVSQTFSVTLSAGDSSVVDLALTPLVNTTDVFDEDKLLLEVFNPFEQTLRLRLPHPQIIDRIQLLQPTGQLMYSRRNLTEELYIPTAKWSKGIYVVQLLDKQGRVLHTQQVVKP